MSMWTLTGRVQYFAGTSGTRTLPKGVQLLQVHAHATSAGSVAIFGGDTITIPAGVGWGWQIQHLAWIAGSQGNPTAGSCDLVFTGTDAYFIEFRYGGAL